MEEIVFDSKWIKVKQTPKGYLFSERKGTNSLAILLYRKIVDNEGCCNNTHLQVLVRMQPLPIMNTQTNDDKETPRLFSCPITGGLEDGVSLINQARAEVREEAGLDIAEVGFQYLGEYYVGTQTNEIVCMFIADVTTDGTEKIEINGDGSYFESISKNEWRDINDVLDARYSGLNILANKLNRMFKAGEI